jgi:lysophospholipase L1-like esterase
MISWNKPIWRRLDHSAWSKSGFTYQYYDLFNGINPGYWQSTSAGSYAQIIVPQGYEHFALVCRQMSGGGILNVTINGQTPSTYPNPYYDSRVETNTIVTADVVPPTLPIGVSAIDLTSTSSRGNFYHIVQFNNLPSGQDNVIKFETASAAQCDIWGGFYWSGNTCVVMNLGHGGHTSSELISKWMTAEVYNENYDAILFEIPEMNNTRLSIDQTKADITSISDRLRGMNVDHCFTSCNILGLSIVHDTNFYNTSPTQLEINDAVRELLSSLGEPFIDIFQYFRWHTERRGGTLAGGQAGLWYTEDGQHGNPAGVKLWFDCLKKVILNKTIMIE